MLIGWSLAVCLVLCLLFYLSFIVVFFFFFKQNTAYEMRISDWSSDVVLFRSGCAAVGRRARACGCAGDQCARLGRRQSYRRRVWREPAQQRDRKSVV